MRAEGVILHYRKQVFWSESGFSEILILKDKFEFGEVNSFNHSLQKHGKVMVDPEVEFNEQNNQPL